MSRSPILNTKKLESFIQNSWWQPWLVTLERARDQAIISQDSMEWNIVTESRMMKRVDCLHVYGWKYVSVSFRKKLFISSGLSRSFQSWPVCRKFRITSKSPSVVRMSRRNISPWHHAKPYHAESNNWWWVTRFDLLSQYLMLNHFTWCWVRRLDVGTFDLMMMMRHDFYSILNRSVLSNQYSVLSTPCSNRKYSVSDQ